MFLIFIKFMTLLMLYNNLIQTRHKYLITLFFYYLLIFIIINQNYYRMVLIFILYVNKVIRSQNKVIMIINAINMLFLVLILMNY